MNSRKKQNYLLQQLSNCIRVLSADAVETAGSGHPGLPLGFSDVFTCLAAEFLRFNPSDCKWFDRDRLILSAGHGSVLLYSFFYLAGYSNFTLEDIKHFRQLGSKSAGHPESHLYEAIETTTGPLGQGLANSVGMAIAAKKYQAKLDSKISNHKIYAIVGDGCMMEGISYEALSLAGHLKLNNLVVLFDDNGISIDGKTTLATSEDHISKLKSLGFLTLECDGHNFDEIWKTLSYVQNVNLPSFIAFKTKIGKGTKNKEGSEKSHGSALGKEEIDYLKDNIGFNRNAFDIPKELKNEWEKLWLRNQEDYARWQNDFQLLSKDEKSYIYKKKLIMSSTFEPITNSEATRISSSKIIESLLLSNDKIIIGSADLSSSNGLLTPSVKPITADDFSGNYIYYGVREHAMAAIMNGLVLSSFSAVGGTFLVFSDYMKPSIRLACLMKLPVIYIFTHDSIGVGEDGPTHQPVEHLAALRAIPNIDVLRPADLAETIEAYQLALENQNKPTAIVLSRQNLPQLRTNNSNDNLSLKGGYVISEASNSADILTTIFASGSEVHLAIEVQNLLENKGFSTRICSVPSTTKLLSQDKEYLDKLKGNAKHIVAIEAACSFGWSSIIGNNGLFFGVDDFGISAPAKEVYKHFKLDANSISSYIIKHI